MPSLEELRNGIALARAELLEATDLAAEGWEQARGPESSGEEGWSPRQAAEHAIGADAGFARAVAYAVGTEPPPRPEVVLETSGAARSASTRAGELADAVYDRLESNQLTAETRFADNVEGVLELAARHLLEHAQQIVGQG